MSDEPQPPESIPKYLRDGVQKQDASTLRDLAAYAERLADYKEAQAERELQAKAVDEDVPDDWDDDEWADALDEARDDGDVPPSKGTLTTKEIDGRRYFYLQWREGDKIKSQYVGPVVPSNS